MARVRGCGCVRCRIPGARPGELALGRAFGASLRLRPVPVGPQRLIGSVRPEDEPMPVSGSWTMARPASAAGGENGLPSPLLVARFRRTRRWTKLPGLSVGAIGALGHERLSERHMGGGDHGGHDHFDKAETGGHTCYGSRETPRSRLARYSAVSSARPSRSRTSASCLAVGHEPASVSALNRLPGRRSGPAHQWCGVTRGRSRWPPASPPAGSSAALSAVSPLARQNR